MVYQLFALLAHRQRQRHYLYGWVWLLVIVTGGPAQRKKTKGKILKCGKDISKSE
jgi:hypothetical protein